MEGSGSDPAETVEVVPDPERPEESKLMLLRSSARSSVIAAVSRSENVRTWGGFLKTGLRFGPAVFYWAMWRLERADRDWFSINDRAQLSPGILQASLDFS